MHDARVARVDEVRSFIFILYVSSARVGTRDVPATASSDSPRLPPPALPLSLLLTLLRTCSLCFQNYNL